MKEIKISKMPIEELLVARGNKVQAKKDRYLSFDDLRLMLSKYPVEFVVATIGQPLKWIDIKKCHAYWKSEIKAHLVKNPDSNFSLSDYPNSYCYIASEWSGEIQTPIVLLETHH